MYPEPSKSKRTSLCACLLGLAILTLGGCVPVEGRQFRETALPAIESGMSSILNGILDGVFASIAVESSTTDSSGNSAA